MTRFDETDPPTPDDLAWEHLGDDAGEQMVRNEAKRAEAYRARRARRERDPWGLGWAS